MSLPVRTNAFGFHEFKPAFKEAYAYQEKSTGKTWFEDKTFYQVEHQCSRGEKTSSRKVLLPNSSTLWRKPNPYGRAVLIARYNVGKHRDDFGWYTRTSTSICTASPWVAGQGVIPDAFYNHDVRWSSNLENEALAKAIGKVKDQKAALGEALAESAKTYSMIVDAGTTLLKAALAVKRGNPAQAWSLLKDGRSVVRRGADLYCQYKYGWRPLMSDIHGLWELFQEQLRPAQLIKAVAVSQTESVRIVSIPGVKREGQGTRGCKVVLWGQITDPVMRLPERLGLNNPLSLGWELVPMSFVVDWFVPVGKTLDAFSSPKGVSFIGGTATTFGKAHLKFEQAFGVGSDVITPKDGTIDIEASQRRVYSGGQWPKPGFYAVNPFKSKTNHGLEAFALLLQRLTR